MRMIAVLLLAGLVGCSTTSHHGEYTRGGVSVDHKADLEECSAVAQKKATGKAYGGEGIGVGGGSIRDRTVEYMSECMTEKGYEWVWK